MASRRNDQLRCRLRPVLIFLAFSAVVLLAQLDAFASAAKGSSKWLTLTASAPKVIARGGFSGLVPDSSMLAYQMASLTSVEDLVQWCDVQLTKDGLGVCFPNIRLDNSSAIASLRGAKKSTYDVNGVPLTGYFPIDYTLKQLSGVGLMQGIYSRPPNFDGAGPIVTPQTVFENLQPVGFWLNVQYPSFYNQHNLSMSDFLLGTKNLIFDYLSSPELQFLKGIAPKFGNETKLIFRFMGQDETEPTTNQTYGSLLKNLKLIRSFADGILVPKTYIWPSDSSLYLLPATSLVQDAHGAGLLVFAADFANDNVISYNYSYNPVSEYLQFIDNGDFSVDGVLSDFPVTPSEAIGCFAHLGKNATVQASPSVISNNGASGDYPGCTDLAYSKAISDGANVIDCNVQMSKDGIPFCLSTINLMDSTTIAQTDYFNMTEIIPELQSGDGIFTFRLTWKEIQGLTPSIFNPFSTTYNLVRNPKFKNAGSLISLAEFLDLTKNASSLSGVLIKIEYAAYLAQKQGLNVTEAVTSALEKSGYNNQTAQKLMIQSTNTAVLKVFKGKSYDLVYKVDEQIRDFQNSTAEYLDGLASSVVIRKDSIFPLESSFTVSQTDVVQKFQAFNLSVYAEVFTNEFVSQAWDFFSDPIFEINSYVQGAGVDGIVTQFPLSAVSYRKNRCLPEGKNTPSYMLPVKARGLFQLMTSGNLPPAAAPAPVLTESDVTEPPLPPTVEVEAPSASPAGSPSLSGNKGSGSSHIKACAFLWMLALVASAVQLF